MIEASQFVAAVPESEAASIPKAVLLVALTLTINGVDETEE